MKAGKPVKPYKGVAINGGFTKYSVSQSKKNADGTWKNVGWLNIMVKGGTPIPDKNPDKVQLVIENIQGVDLDEYNGKLNVTVWAEGHTEGGEPSQSVTNGFSQLDDSECPF